MDDLRLSTFDGNTRDLHRLLDGQIREIDEPFEAGGIQVDAPGMFGDPAEDCNCRCCILQRARWALDDDELQRLKDRAEYFGLDKTTDFEEYQTKYFKVSFQIEHEKDIANTKNGDNIKDIMFKVSKSDVNIIRDEKAVVDAYSQLPDKVQKAMADVTFNMGQNGSSCDVKKGVINVAKGAEKENIDHEFGHLIEERMLDPKVVEEYMKYLTEGLSDADITSEIYENDSGEKFNIYILHGDKFISEYQGRLYVSRISDAVNPDGSIKTEFLLESTSELFRVYQKDKTILSTYEIGLVEESLK
jgi:hypothetical protein